MKAERALRSPLEGRSTVVSRPSWVAEAEHWESHHEEVPWVQPVLRKVLVGRMPSFAGVGILEERMLAWEGRMDLTQPRVERHREERKHLHH